MDDLRVSPGPGVPFGLLIPAAELDERFSRSSGPGGQSVNTADTRVELSFDIARSPTLSDTQRARLLRELGPRLTDGVLTLAASEQRSQLRNRIAARERLAGLLSDALAPPPQPRRPTRPSAADRQRRQDGKIRRSAVKAGRRRPDLD